MDRRRVKLAMRVGSKYRLHDIRVRDWASLAEELGLDPDRTIARMAELAAAVSEAMPEIRARAIEAGLDHPIVPRLSELIVERAAECQRELRGQRA